MNSKKFTEAMSELDSKYVDEALNYKFTKKRHGWIKWVATAAACLVLVYVAAISLFPGNDDNNVTTPGIADAAPMVYVNDTLYMQSLEQTSYKEIKADFVYLGNVESDVTNDQSTTDGVPKENFQSNTPIVGAEIYQYGDDIVIQIDGEYWLYEILDDKNHNTQGELSETEKMELDPSYKTN